MGKQRKNAQTTNSKQRAIQLMFGHDGKMRFYYDLKFVIEKHFLFKPVYIGK